MSKYTLRDLFKHEIKQEEVDAEFFKNIEFMPDVEIEYLLFTFNNHHYAVSCCRYKKTSYVVSENEKAEIGSYMVTPKNDIFKSFSIADTRQHIKELKIKSK